MRVPRQVVVSLLGLGLLATSVGCSGRDTSADAGSAVSPSASGSAEAPPETSPGAPTGSPSGSASAEPFVPAPALPEVAGTEACEQVRAGVDAFNAGDLDETVARFEAAVPLAERQADGSPASNELVEAVRWYAALPAEDYPEAFASSPEFARYQAITLSQCGDDAPGEAESSPVTPV